MVSEPRLALNSWQPYHDLPDDVIVTFFLRYIFLIISSLFQKIKKYIEILTLQ